MTLHPFAGRVALLGLAVAVASATGIARADDAYPCRTLILVSPYPPGGSTDILARLVAPRMSTELGATVVVENRGGASSNIGTEFVARAAPDGCTALLGNNTGIVINRNLYDLKLDPSKALAPVGEVASVPLVLYENVAVPAESVQQLIGLIRKSPGTFNYASGGSGSPQHLAGELLKLDQHIDMVHVPYRGQGPALADVLAGTVPIAFETTSALAPQVNGGRIRLLAITSERRAPTLPTVPTMKEAGIDNFVIENWYGLFVPEKTPHALVVRFNTALNAALRSEEVRGKLAELGSTDVSNTPEQFHAFIEKEVPYWSGIVKRSNAKVD